MLVSLDVTSLHTNIRNNLFTNITHEHGMEIWNSQLLTLTTWMSSPASYFDIGMQ